MSLNYPLSSTLFWRLLWQGGRIILLAAAYVQSGQLAMLLAAPPGFVSAIFPPVGVSLAAVLIWGYPMLLGVFLGSSLLNLSISGVSIAALSLESLLVPCSIALGTTAQCLVASWSIKRWVGFPSAMTADKQIFWILLIGGPLSCLLSATAGISVLYHHQIITSGQLLFSWWSWWVGDSIGVLIAMPLMFIAFASPRDIWRSRISTVGLPLLLSCALMVVLFFRTIEDEQSRLQQHFHEQAKLMAQSIQSRLELYTSAIKPVERFFAASAKVSNTDFATFVSATAQNHAGIRALSWNPKVLQQERLQFEAELTQDANSTGQVARLSINERDDDDTLVPAGNRASYFPIRYIEPLAQNRAALGYDVASEPVRQQAMFKARNSGNASLTAPLSMVQDHQHQIGMLLFYPVYQGHQLPATLAGRQQLLRGYVVAVLHITEVIASALVSYPQQSFQLQLDDISTGRALPLYHTQSNPVPAYARALAWQQEFEVAGRRFSLHIEPSEQFLQAQSSLQPWAILTGGLLLCSLLGGFLLSVTGRAEQVRRQVKQRTLELTGILNNAAEAILIFNSAGGIERANIAAQQLFGYSNNQLLQLPIGSLLPEFKHAGETELSQKQGRAIEAVGNSAAGVMLELEISLSSYSLPGHTWFICLLHDISERKKIARLKSEFVATVSHELRTPLTSIKGALELVNAGVLGTIPEAAGNMLCLACKNTERLELLVNDILDIEKLELAEASLVLSPLNLADQLQLALQQNQSYATSYAVTLCLDMEQLPATTKVMAHNQRLQQVFSNLISNAVKFSPAQSQVQIKARLQGQQAIVSFSDQGPGIAEEFRSRIFQKFAQADGSDTRQRGGTGLGLSICKALMEKMHGSIGFDSIEGKGSTFFIILPLVDEEPEAPTSAG
ncbi:CHASE domain-containing protein [Rheinheimera sp.]|uniref:CHASE domain-containing protein n=1 Tax=Rheinheimera sp. TaxID=1869214 RepID=UPI002FDDBA96